MNVSHREGYLTGNTHGPLLARVGLALYMAAICLGAFACEDNICKKAMRAFVQREAECFGIEDYDSVPDEVECSEEIVDEVECDHQCYMLPCSTPIEEYNQCIRGCAR